ncbi:hypothetical protein [Paenibacillus paridis]|uniref:hypothetical protein n=1 Tax=Paenibacillus paridis TaxID=2583376 RepID=UPI001122FFF0|nr:hypothetical protein [Paenibacillus paridis]
MSSNKLFFAPGSYVPVSGFIRLNPGLGLVDIEVQSDLLAYIASSKGRILAACYANEMVTYFDVQHVDLSSGLVRIEPREAGIYTLVSERLRNDFPIVTNWNAALNGGRGGPQAGAADGIGVLRLHAETGEREVDLQLRDEDPSSPYYYQTDTYALFAGEKEGESFRTPAYERYIGETYSVLRVTDEAALKLSDEIRELTGYPIIFRVPTAAPEQLEGMPAFQLVHGRIAGQGEHESMVSYILPPLWSTSLKEHYPALFSGFYDQNENVFSTMGPPLLKGLGQAFLETGKGAVGIIWNGGGSFGTRTMQASIYENLDDVFRIAIEQYGVNGHEVVTVGGSRGGISSLMAAGNPGSTVYSVRYAVCYNVPLAFGEPFRDMLNPTCPVCWRAVCEDIGYKNAWQPGWKDGEGRSAVDLFLATLLGTSDSVRIASGPGPASDAIILALKSKGTKVWLTHGTHDAYTSSWLSFEWADRARRHGVQVRHEIGYRYGHNNCTNPFDSAKLCLVSLLTGQELPMEGNWHYRRASEVPEAWEESELFEPARQPIFLEGPKFAIAGLPMLLILYGEPGMEYRLALQPSWEQNAIEPITIEPIVMLEGTMPVVAGGREGFSYVKSVQPVPDQLVPGIYVYDLEVRRSNEDTWERPAMHAPQPGIIEPATLEVIADVPHLANDEWLERTMKHAIGWGLSEA